MKGVLPPRDQLMGALPQPSLTPDINSTQQGAGTIAGINQGGGYNGVVNVDGQPVEVVDGMADFDGDSYFVSEDGSFVVNSSYEIVGRVVDGEFVPIDDEYLDELRASGKVKAGE